MKEPSIALDLKPQLTSEALHQRLAQILDSNEWPRALKLSPAATALTDLFQPDTQSDRERFVARVKNLILPLQGPRPIAEAISSAGGVAWREVDEHLMLRKLPGIFVAGEMIDWEAPTGGYLLQGCFSTGTRAGRSAAGYAMAFQN
jgi:predicted flavoprotein YhiN